MLPWHKATRSRFSNLSLSRSLSNAAAPNRVQVRCGSAGHVTIDLFNVPDDSSTSDPLLIHLPPFPSQDGHASELPLFLRNRQVASINYRWSPFSKAPMKAVGGEALTSLHWPTPVHDTSFSYSWLLENLTPRIGGRRDIYIYGSYLGASLATSLALTEAHTHARFGVRGLIAYNGVYNWTMFLPDHRINKSSARTRSMALSLGPAEGSQLHALQQHVPALFGSPVNLFDPFASPSLFFHSPGLLVPQSFFMTAEHAALVDKMTGDEKASATLIKAPRKSHLVFPPRQSTLKIPETLLLYDSEPLAELKVSLKTRAKRPRKRSRESGHNFRAQARELTDLMRRSVDRVELRERSKWDDNMSNWAGEASRRVEIVEAGPEGQTLELSQEGHDAVTSWIECRL